MTNPLNEKPHAIDVPLSGAAGMIVEGRYLPPPADKDGKIWVRTTAILQRSSTDLYKMWRDVEGASGWQEEIISVRKTGETTSHWTMRANDKTIEWNSIILADEPGKRIAWQSISGDLENAGEVIFEPTVDGQGTIVTVLQEFHVGKLANAWETVVGRNPKQAVVENLRHFKALAETGEIPRTEGQPHGPRGSIGSIKKSLYGEKVDTPTGISCRAS